MTHPGASGNSPGRLPAAAPARAGERPGDKREFAPFYREHITRLVAYLIYQDAAAHLAADIAQDAMITAYRRWADITSPRAYVYTVAYKAFLRYGPDASGGEDRVERGGEVRAAVADHELDLVCLVAEIHEEVAGLLGGPPPGGMQGDPEDADAPGRVLDHGQDIGLGAVKQVDREEVAGQNRLGLGAQELRPGRPRSAAGRGRCRWP
jgi:hypothetical protein